MNRTALTTGPVSRRQVRGIRRQGRVHLRKAHDPPAGRAELWTREPPPPAVLQAAFCGLLRPGLIHNFAGVDLRKENLRIPCFRPAPTWDRGGAPAWTPT